VSWTPAYGRDRGPYYHGLLAQPDCESCPLRYDVKVFPDGPVPARIAFIGEEPGQTEIAEGRGFVGQSGQLLWHLARDVGLERDDIWVSNAALCAARKVKLNTGANLPQLVVKAMAAKACRRRLLAELVTVDPIVVVPLGNWALWATSDIPNARIYAYRGSRIEVDLAKLLELVQQGLSRSPMRTVKEQ
jgi:uracil-DNA glycosylase family 4